MFWSIDEYDWQSISNIKRTSEVEQTEANKWYILISTFSGLFIQICPACITIYSFKPVSKVGKSILVN